VSGAGPRRAWPPAAPRQRGQLRRRTCGVTSSGAPSAAAPAAAEPFWSPPASAGTSSSARLSLLAGTAASSACATGASRPEVRWALPWACGGRRVIRWAVGGRRHGQALQRSPWLPEPPAREVVLASVQLQQGDASPSSSSTLASTSRLPRLTSPAAQQGTCMR
jgi:hypothetical protein